MSRQFDGEFLAELLRNLTSGRHDAGEGSRTLGGHGNCVFSAPDSLSLPGKCAPFHRKHLSVASLRSSHQVKHPSNPCRSCIWEIEVMITITFQILYILNPPSNSHYLTFFYLQASHGPGVALATNCWSR